MADLTDNTTQLLLEQWAAHRAEGKRRGFTRRDEWEVPPDWATREADEWVRQDAAWKLILGVRLAVAAIENYEQQEQS